MPLASLNPRLCPGCGYPLEAVEDTVLLRLSSEASEGCVYEEELEAVECWRRDRGVESMPASFSLLRDSRYDITCDGGGQSVSVPFELASIFRPHMCMRLARRSARFGSEWCLSVLVYVYYKMALAATCRCRAGK